PPAGQGADDRRRLLPPFDRLADPLPAQQPRVRRALPAHDVRGAERAAAAQAGGRQGLGPAVHPARRPRAERFDLDRAPGRLHRLAEVPTIAAAGYRHSIGWPIRYPRNNLEYVERFLHMMFEVPSEPLQLKPVAAKALDLLFILHADHEQNASTSTVRLVGSTGANPYACVAAGVAALWGPAHGGANEAVLKMLEEIGRPEHVSKAVARAKDKESGFRLMGFGHRVYKNFDPRATIIREMCHKVLDELGVDDPLLEVAMRLEEAALKDEYFIQRKLYPNVDFYSGIIYKALNIPTEMFTVMFAIARTAGWVSHWLEQQTDPEAKIGR